MVFNKFYWPICCYGAYSRFLLARLSQWSLFSNSIGGRVTTEPILKYYWLICRNVAYSQCPLANLLIWRFFSHSIGQFVVTRSLSNSIGHLVAMELILNFYWPICCYGALSLFLLANLLLWKSLYTFIGQFVSMEFIL